MTDRARRVILLIDYDNLQICASRDTPGRDLQLEPVVQLAQHYGTVMHARAYAEWNLSTERLAVYKAGIEPAFAPVLRTESDRTGKSLADTVMVAEGMDMLWTLAPEVMVLATSDKDLIPLVRVAKQRGAHVVVLGSDFTAVPLREMADEHITYKQLITDGPARSAELAATRQPTAVSDGGRRSRLSDRDRKDREPRETREPREPRAAAVQSQATVPAATQQAPATTPPVAAPISEAVAPIANGGEGDGQLGGRRRRRRGSRHRLERGVGADEGSGAEDQGDDAVHSENGVAAFEDEAPTNGEVAAAEAATDLLAGDVEGYVPEEPVSEAPVEAAEAAEVLPEEEQSVAELGAAEPETSATLEPSVQSPYYESDNGVAPNPLTPEPVQAETLEETPTGEGEEPPKPAPRTRARRVASASRGRTRPTSRG